MRYMEKAGCHAPKVFIFWLMRKKLVFEMLHTFWVLQYCRTMIELWLWWKFPGEGNISLRSRRLEVVQWAKERTGACEGDRRWGKGALARKAPENLACVAGKYFHHKLMFSLNFKNRDMIWPILDYSYSLDKAFLLDKAFHSPKFRAKIFFTRNWVWGFYWDSLLKLLELFLNNERLSIVNTNFPTNK